MINIGEPRNVSGHIVSGALASGMVAGAMNYDRYTKKQMRSDEAIKDALKLSVQGGIATGSAIAAANYLGRGNIFGMLSAISLGIAGIYGIEKVYEKSSKKVPLEATEENPKEVE